MATQSATILLTEDDDLVRDSLRVLLESNGFTVLEAHDGAEALRLFRTHQGTIDLLITDLAMPRMNGRDLVERVRSFHPDLPVIYISGKASAPLLKKIVLHEGSNFLSKPFSYPKLIHKVRAVLDGRAALGAFAPVKDRLVRYAAEIGVVVKLDAVESGVRVLIPSSAAPINDAVITGYIEEELGLPLVEDRAAAPPSWRRLGIIVGPEGKPPP